jgi:transcriptional regulator with XRE-family HTH domain
MVKNGNMKQEVLAKFLGCSSSQLSNIMNGKTAPGMGFLMQCKDYFSLDKNGSIDFFSTAFSSSDRITLDMSCLHKTNKDRLIGVLVPLLIREKKEYVTGDDFIPDNAIERKKTSL